MLPNALRCRLFLQLGWRLTLLRQGYGGQAQTSCKIRMTTGPLRFP